MSIIAPEIEMVDRSTRSIRYLEHGWPNDLCRWHAHKEYELHLITETRGKAFVGDHIGDFKAGDLFMTGPNLPHNWVSDIELGTQVQERDMLIQFTPDFGDTIANSFAEFSGIKDMFVDSVFGISFTGVARAEGARLLHLIGASEGSRRLFLFLELMDLLGSAKTERNVLSRSAPAMGIHTPHSRTLQTAIQHIYENYTQDLYLGSVANLVNMEASTFSRFFKKQTGHTFSRFIIQLRVHHACRLLAQPDLSITQICFDSGFNNTANFNRQFAAVCGETPSLYRQSAKRLATSSG